MQVASCAQLYLPKPWSLHVTWCFAKEEKFNSSLLIECHVVSWSSLPDLYLPYSRPKVLASAILSQSYSSELLMSWLILLSVAAEDANTLTTPTLSSNYDNITHVDTLARITAYVSVVP